MYAVFCTANIPSEVLDEFIDEAYGGWFDMLACHPQHPNFAQSTFTILDQNAVEHKMSRIGHIEDERYPPDDRMLWADFYSDLYMRVPIGMRTIDWEDEVATAETVGGDEQVLTAKKIEEASDRAYAREEREG